MTDKHVPWATPSAENAAQPGHPLSNERHDPGAGHGSGAPFRPLPAAPLTAPGVLSPLSAQYALSPRFQHGAHAPPSPAPGSPAAARAARGGTLPPNVLSQQDVLSASGVFAPSALPFVPAPQAERVAASGMPFVPGSTTDRMRAVAMPPPAPGPPALLPLSGGVGPGTPLEPMHSALQMPPGQPSFGPSSSRGMPLPSSLGPVLSPAPLEPSSARSPMPSGMPFGPPPGMSPPAMGPPGGSAHDNGAVAVPESPWATTMSRVDAPALPSALLPERAAHPAKSSVPAPPAESQSRMPILVLSAILAVALVVLGVISVWHGVGGRAPISIGYTEPSATAEGASAPSGAGAASSPSSGSPRLFGRPRPKSGDIYDEAEKEKRR